MIREKFVTFITDPFEKPTGYGGSAVGNGLTGAYL